MNFLATIFLLVNSVLLFKLPRRWAALPLLIGATYMTLGQAIDLGPLTFTVIRILVAVGLIRTFVRRETVSGGWIILDTLMVAWGAIAVLNSAFHQDVSATLTNRLGMVYDGLGLYFLMRTFIGGRDGIETIAKIVVLTLIPISLEMMMERITGTNFFAVFGGVSPECEIRESGQIRAQGPFGHSILAGTVGAVSWPLGLIIWKGNRKLAVMGCFAAVTMVLTSGSSGPVMTVVAILMALALWRLRRYMQAVRWGVVVGVLALAMVMNAPIYYLLARVDLTGSSSGYFRAVLIEAAIHHFDEWWLVGTDYTRHWMYSGVGWSPDHTDITNYYIKMGVLGGLPLLLLLVSIIVAAFISLARALRRSRSAPFDQRFLLWVLGSILFGHVVTMVSISYFDQSIIFLYFILASIASVEALSRVAARSRAKAAAVVSNPVSPPTILAPMVNPAAGV